MNNEKILFFSQRLQEDKVVYFRLYNALYKVNFDREQLSIQQNGLEVGYNYSSLQDLFYNYFVYGANLIDSIDDIKII